MTTPESEIDFTNPCSLFKYRAFDQYAIQSLIDGKVWLADPRSFNDPFDCVYYIDREHSNEELLAYLNDCAQSSGDTRQFTLGDIPQERLNYYGCILDALEEGDTENKYAQLLLPTCYRHKSAVLGYGLKFWPGAFEALKKKTPQLDTFAEGLK